MIIKKITKTPPKLHILIHWVGILSHLKSLRRGFIFPTRQSYSKLFFLVELASYYFIHDKWDINISTKTFGVQLENDRVVGLGLYDKGLSTLRESIKLLEKRGVEIYK